MNKDNRKTLLRHSAQASLEGYIYQIQQATHILFRLEEGSSLGIEILDDIHVEIGGIPTDLIQVKNHQAGSAVALTSRSMDLWKTLGIWAAAIRERSIDLESARHFVMITRAKSRPGSIPALIASGSKPEEIIQCLRGSGCPIGQEARIGYEAVQALNDEELTKLVERLVLLDEQPPPQGIDVELRRLLRQKTFDPATIDAALQQIYGWVFSRVMLGPSQSGILIDESAFQMELRTIRDRFVPSEPHPRHSREIPAAETLAGQAQRTYVRQLQRIEASESVRRRAIVAFLRASSERSDWLARGEIAPDDLTRFDGELFDRWETEHEDMCDRCNESDDDNRLCTEARTLFGVIERINIPFRPGSQYQYLTMGSYQILADDLEVGWHRDFRHLFAGGSGVPTVINGSPYE